MKNILNKISIVILLAIVAVSCKKRDGFIIHGTISGDLVKEVDSIMINRESMTENKPIYAVPVIDGKFTIEGKVSAIEKVNIGNKKAEIGNTFILENAEYTIDINEELYTVKGGKLQEQVFGFYNSKEYNEIMQKYFDISRQMDKLDPEDEDVQEEVYQLGVQVDDIMIKASKIEDNNYKNIFNNKNSSTLAKMFVLTNSQNYREFPTEKRRKLLNEYKKELGEHNNITSFLEYLDQQDERDKMKKSITNGTKYKPVKGTDENGNVIDLADVIKKNKLTLLEFWAAWCGPCRAEVPHLKEAYAKFKDKGFEIYSYSIDDSSNEWKQAMKEDQPNWKTHVLKQGKEGEKILNSYGIDGIPASYLITSDGTIVAMNEELRGIALQETLKKLLKK